MKIVGREHDGSYGTGRFCSDHCRHSYSGKKVQHYVCNFKNEGKKAPFGTWKCNHCDFIGETKAQLISHKKEKHPEFTGKDHKGWRGWNKGLTAETNESIKRGRETYKRHLKEGKFKPSQLGKPILEEIKKKISNSMKKAHEEGRAHNIGNCRWNNEPSYPEKFFMKVIANEFEDKNYTREYPFFGFSLDFAWPLKKKCIEIDGEQHERFEDYKERDRRKDAKILENGWTCLRIKWKNMYENTKDWIKIAKDFIDS